MGMDHHGLHHEVIRIRRMRHDHVHCGQAHQAHIHDPDNRKNQRRTNGKHIAPIHLRSPRDTLQDHPRPRQALYVYIFAVI